eukprot:s3454_g5.t1
MRRSERCEVLVDAVLLRQGAPSQLLPAAVEDAPVAPDRESHDAHVANLERFLTKLQSYPGMLERCVKDKRYVAEQFQLMESSSMVETQEAGSEGDDDADAADVFAPVSWLWYFISGDASWILELELREFIEVSDVSFEKDGSVRKRSLRCRDDWASWQLADDGRLAVMRAVAVKDARGVQLCADAALSFRVGVGEVCDALESAACSMKEGEIAEFTVSDSQLCLEKLLGTQDLPDGGALLRLHLESLDRKDAVMPPPGDEGKLEVLTSRKSAATELFKAGRYRLAAHRFRLIYEQLGYIDDFRGVRGGEGRQKQVGELRE